LEDALWIILILLGAAVGATVGALIARHRLRHTVRDNRQLQRQASDSEHLAYVGRLTGGLMHELKNPLSTLNLNLQLLAEDLQSPETDTERRTARKVEVLREETQRLEDILNRFTAFAGRMQVHKTTLDVAELVSDLVAFYEPQAQQHSVTLRSSLPEDIPPIDADPDLLKQALLNLILNAQNAMPDNGELMISVRPDERHVVLTVTDTGGGIPADELDKVFDAYYSTRRGGSGLGLPIVRRIVREHGGTIDIASETGRGTQVMIRLPQADAGSGETG
jgi:signal transduction histidine kinase